MSTPNPLSPSDEKLTTLLSQLRSAPLETAGEAIVRAVREHLAHGAYAEAQQAATTLRKTTDYPAAMMAIAEAQRLAGDLDAARQTLVTAQQQVQQFAEGDSRNGYPRAYYLTELVKAQLRLGDVAGAIQTAQTITVPEYQRQARLAVAQAK